MYCLIQVCVSGTGVHVQGNILCDMYTSSDKTMKSTKVQTLGAVTLCATTDCTDGASIVGLGPLNWAIV